MSKPPNHKLTGPAPEGATMTEDTAGAGPVERGLGPLPAPFVDDYFWLTPEGEQEAPLWDESQMRAYAAQEVAAERERWQQAAEAMAQEADRKFPENGTVAHWLRALVAKRGG